jgi:hypothetical protein
MKKYVNSDLINELIERDINILRNDPLSDIKNEMGELARLNGNPLFSAEIHLRVNIHYIDAVAGIEIAPLALPQILQVPVPVHLFGLTDLHGGFHNCEKLNKIPLIIGGWTNEVLFALNNGIWNTEIEGFAPVMNAIPQRGDFVSIYWVNDPLLLPFTAYWMLLIIHCTNVAYGTLLNSFVSDLIRVNRIRYILNPADIEQFNNPLSFGYQSLLGKFVVNNIDPKLYQLPTEFQNNISDIKINFPIDKKLIISTMINFGVQELNFIFFIEKIEPLTLKKLW